MSGIRIMNSAAPQGQERMMIMNDVSGGQLRLFPGSNQVVIAGMQSAASLERTTFQSTDSGDSYSELPDSWPALITDNTAVSFNNRYYYVGDSSTVNGNYYLASSNDFGQSWTYDPSAYNLVSSRRFLAVSTSRDGKYAISGSGGYGSDGEALLTRDFGQTWERPLATDQWYRTFVDTTGQNMLIGGNGFSNPSLITQYSDDYGATWNNFGEGLTTLGNAMISGDGNYKVVWEQYESGGLGARVYVSTDWTNWTQNNLTKRFSGGAISNDGQYMILPPSDSYTTGGINMNVSDDYGQNWNSVALPGVGTEKKWAPPVMSADGKYMMVASGFNDSSPAGAFKSIDYGATWTKIDTGDIPDANYNQVKMSKSGRYTYVTGTANGIIHSKDYMATWTQQYDPSNGQGVFINF